jgi:predicted small secreted protein
MAKGKIKVSTDNEHGIVVNENNREIKYVQPFSKELGLIAGRTVRFDVYTDPATQEKTAYNVELYRKGIITGKDNDTGMIADANFGEIMAYVPMMKEQGIATGDTVKYDLLGVDKGVFVAVYVKLAEPDTK